MSDRFELKRPLLAALILMIDRSLQRLQGVFEYSNKPDCLFRIRFDRLRTEVVLSDGTFGRPGDPVVELHLWNEHIPVLPAAGPSLAWGRQLNRCFAESLGELTRFLMSQPEFLNITMVRANMSVGSKAQSDQLYRIVSRHGFEIFPDAVGLSLAVHVRRFGENILYWLLTLVFNPAAARSNKFWRSRGWIYLSRRVLERKYAAANERPFDSGSRRRRLEHSSKYSRCFHSGGAPTLHRSWQSLRFLPRAALASASALNRFLGKTGTRQLSL
jgi:hypothetical protein